MKEFNSWHQVAWPFVFKAFSFQQQRKGKGLLYSVVPEEILASLALFSHSPTDSIPGTSQA